MSIEIRRAGESEEVKKLCAVCELTFGVEASDEDLESLAGLMDPNRMFGAYDGDQIVGSAGNWTLEMTIPGGTLPAAGVTLIGVLPSHRRQGILRKLMKELLKDAEERSEPIAILWASESNIYQRFGYGFATRQGWISMQRDRFQLLDDSPPTGKVRLVSKTEAFELFPPLFDHVRLRTPGMLVRTEAGWQHRFRDPEKEREGASPNFYAVLELNGEPAGYAVYRVKPEWSGHPKGKVQVSDLVSTSPEATREIWRFLFGVDLVETVESSLILPEDDPLQLMVTEPRRLRFHVQEALWLRILDLRTTLEARSYSGTGSVVLEVEDDMYPQNHGRWLVEVSGGKATVTNTDRAADAKLHIRDLAATYLGAFSMANLVSAARVAELAPGAAGRFDALFRTSVAPCCPEIF